MTREEAKRIIVKTIEHQIKKDFQPIDFDTNNKDSTFVLGYRLIDKIYDDFESRTCENCKYNIATANEDIMWCNNSDALEDFEVFANFGCNKFERREKC